MTHKSGNAAQSMKDKHGEAMEYHKNAIGVYRTPSESEQKMLVGQLDVSEQFSGKRKREIGLVVPAKFKALTKEYRLAKTLDEQLQARKEKYTHFEIVHVEKSKNFQLCIKDFL